VAATVRSIHARMEFEAAGIDVSRALCPFAVEYKIYYDRAIADAKKANPKRSYQELQESGEVAGKERVSTGFSRGWVVTSTTGVPSPGVPLTYWNLGENKGPKWSHYPSISLGSSSTPRGCSSAT
jgi:hypothetical protein